MLKAFNDFLGPVMVVLFFAVMGITPLVIAGLGVLNFRSESFRQRRIALQALGALAIWIILSFVLVMIFIMTVFQYPAYKSSSDELISTVIFVGGGLIYFLVSGVLIVWTRRQKRRLPGMGISC